MTDIVDEIHQNIRNSLYVDFREAFTQKDELLRRSADTIILLRDRCKNLEEKVKILKTKGSFSND